MRSELAVPLGEVVLGKLGQRAEKSASLKIVCFPHWLCKVIVMVELFVVRAV